MNEPQFFDFQIGHKVISRRLSHWGQAGTVCFITWRTIDSMPQAVVEHWVAERDSILRSHGIEPPGTWRKKLKCSPKLVRNGIRWKLMQSWGNGLDECHGGCVLRQPVLSEIVANALLRFDGKRYELFDFVVMPNHVHVLASFPDLETMLRQCKSWKHYTAAKINQHLCRRGKFWQQDSFDHLVRSAEHFAYFRRYIGENPTHCRLREDEYRRYSKALT